MSYLKNNYGGKKAFLKYITYRVIYYILDNYNYKYLANKKIDRVVFVCKGNICRSPLAEYVFKSESKIETTSFGLDTTSYKPAHSTIVSIASKLGYNLQDHQTTAQREFIQKPNDLFVCMEPKQADAIKKIYKTENIFLLGSFCQPQRHYLHDPYSTNEDYSKLCCELIIESTKKLAAKLNTK